MTSMQFKRSKTCMPSFFFEISRPRDRTGQAMEWLCLKLVYSTTYSTYDRKGIRLRIGVPTHMYTQTGACTYDPLDTTCVHTTGTNFKFCAKFSSIHMCIHALIMFEERTSTMVHVCACVGAEDGVSLWGGTYMYST